MDDLIHMIDASLIRGEFHNTDKRQLKQYLKQHKLSTHQLNVARAKVFDLVKDSSDSADVIQLVNWLEEVNKCLLPVNKGEVVPKSRAYFSPGNSCEDAIIQQIKAAVDSVKICVFTISENDISNEIIRCFNSGKHLKVITDNDKLNDLGSDVRAIASAGVPVKIDQSKSHMHHKFCIVDNKTLLTGSYNWTRSAAHYNQENLLITQEQEMVQAYLKEFDKLWSRYPFF